ncbi:MAG: hypothetical protein M1832_006124 [Thelocarpon impressellum]|nr:MAG: hypothetical protein M1832_006124 [Thelocarpon impressellum]
MTDNSSLSFITENSPAWVARLDDLTGQIASRQAELSQLAGRPLRHKHGSTESLRPKAGDHDEAAREREMALEPSPTLIGDARRYQAHQLRRKRKTASLASGSGTTTYRTRSMIIVYYDSAVQEAFEMIVRNIGTARNNIRKGKMAAAMRKMTARVDDLAAQTDSTSTENLRAQLGFARTSRSRSGPEEKKTVYDEIDAGLDYSQAQCERAAHQFLRDGDCAPEILCIRNKILEINGLAVKEMAALRVADEAERKREEAREREERKQEEVAMERDQGETVQVEEDMVRVGGRTGAIEVDPAA